MKCFIPFAHAKSVYEIKIDFYKSNNVKTLFLDLDNTLDSYKAKEPKEETFQLFKTLKDAGITPIIISNNKKKRVEGYCNALGVRFLYSARKPFARRLNNFLKENNLKKDEVMLVGDQLITDVLVAYNAKIRVVLTEKIVKEDQFTTRFNRLIDNPTRKRMNKKGLLIDWRDKYGNM